MRVVRNRLLVLLACAVTVLPASLLLLAGVMVAFCLPVPWWLVVVGVAAGTLDLLVLGVRSWFRRRPWSAVKLTVRRVHL